MPDGGEAGARAGEAVALAPPPRLALLRQLGPGLASGAADDDPSGIGTYTRAGAQLGHPACWAVLMMVAIQEISPRIGRATGGGIVAALRIRYSA